MRALVEFAWRVVAWIVSRPRVADWLILRSRRAPFKHIRDGDGSLYMERWWLFNPYSDKDGEFVGERYPWCPFSVRVHHIHRADNDAHLHDHPWDFRTIVLMGSYAEAREDGTVYLRGTGSTTSLRHGQYHRIAEVSERLGAVTLFITGRKRGSWGFKVDGRKVPWREYLSAWGQTAGDGS